MPFLGQSGRRFASPGLKSAGPQPTEQSRRSPSLLRVLACVCVENGRPASWLDVAGICSDSGPVAPDA